MSENVEALKATFVSRLAAERRLRGIFKVSLSGEQATSFLVRVGDATQLVDHLSDGETLDVLVSSDAGSLGAILNGSLTVHDALNSKRLRIAGDFAKIALVAHALALG